MVSPDSLSRSGPKGAKRKMNLADHLANPVDLWRLDLIASHLAAVGRWSVKLDRRYPGEDSEPVAMHALYLAAFTYRPGPSAFATWYRVKLMGQTSNLRRAARRRSMAGIGRSELVGSRIDARYYYLDRKD